MPSIKIVSVGSGGGNILADMYLHGLRSVDFLAIDSSDKNLSEFFPFLPVIGLQEKNFDGSSFLSHQEIKDKFTGANLILLVTTLGGDTGSLLSWKLARSVKGLGAFTIALVSMPFNFEGKNRYNLAAKGLQKLSTYVDAIILFDNSLTIQLPNKYVKKFADINRPFYCTARSLVDLLLCANHVNIKSKKVLNWLEENFKGFIRIGYGIAEDESEIDLAINDVVNSPFFDTFSISDTDFIVLNLTINYRNVEQNKINLIKDKLLKDTPKKAKILWGVVFNEEMEEYLRITLFVGKNERSLIYC